MLSSEIKNKFNWILGDNCVGKVTTIARKWKKLKAENLSAKEYSPWLNFNHLSESEMTKLLGFKEKVILKEEDLTLVEKAVRKEDSNLGRVGVNENHFKVSIGVNNNLPQLKECIQESKDLLFKTNPWIRPLSDELINHIIPIDIIEGGTKAGFSSVDARGLVFFSYNEREKFNTIDFAIDYAHEIGHHTLFYFQSTDSIFSNGHDTPIFSGIKKRERPAIMTFHALAAMGFMKFSAVNMLNSGVLTASGESFCRQKIVELNEMLDATITSIKSSTVEFTQIGKILFDELSLTINLKEDS